MANTYYDSQLTAAEIEAALEAIDGVIVPANNGKVLAINNGKLEARSVQWGGGEAVLEPLSVTANGDYTPGAGVDGFDEVHVSVPNSYSASDEGKVVSNGTLVAQTARASQITQNGTYDTTLNNEVTVNVSGGGGSEPSLPAEYQQVEYISVVPYQYISVPTATTLLVGKYLSAKVMQSPLSGTGEAGFWGSNSNGAAELYFENDLIQSYNGTGWSHSLTDRSSVSSRGNVCFIKVYISFYSGNHFKFGQYRPDSYGFTGNLYELLVYSISNSGFDKAEVTVETRLIPCYRKIDSVAGMYDIYRNVFYTNQGSGSFGVGPDVN